MGLQNGLRALIFISVLQGYSNSSKIAFPVDSTSIDKDLEYIRNLKSQLLDTADSREDDEEEEHSLRKKLKEDDENKWNRWTYYDKRKRWHNPDPDEKTISVQLLDEDPYHHGRPAWPHDEYILGLGYFDLNRTPSGGNATSTSTTSTTDNESVTIDNPNPNESEASKYYEWKRLPPRQNSFIGPGFYDVSASSNYYGTSAPTYYRYHPTHQAIADGTGNVQSTQSNPAESVPGTPSESTTSTRHFSPYAPYDYYKRRRLRLQIHPGLIAAPIAGLAAFGAASALTSKPLLLELGYVRNKPDFIGGGGWGLGGGFGGLGGLGGGGGFGGLGGGGYRPYPPFYPPPNPPPHHHHHPPILPPGSIGGGIGGGIGSAHAQAGGGGGGPLYPILRPVRTRPDDNRSSWWNPFSALTPRLVIE